MKTTLIKTFKISLSILLIISLTACMSLGNLSYKQARMLKKEGFTLTEEGWTLRLPDRLLFDFDQAQIQEVRKTEIIQLSHRLQKYHLDKIKIVGHTDAIGSPEYNNKLSLKRAETVADVFLTTGFNPKNIQTIGRGSAQPLAPNDTDENRALNRRVNIIIIP
ncbi:OmpA family protein [Acinetobacter rudis]|uniref:OmpA family protein n=1 Tax=Acinetobacter rudis TaxID=632955 RepID=A0AAW8JEX2_9GAMM|nr:OmpA family protein [Acinetobacter rudis]MDQ8936219.1 OmpA family protein [Acinetobacter rudis]MDQ8954161.1 OmpA family protein [Acinetobacter rudis]